MGQFDGGLMESDGLVGSPEVQNGSGTVAAEAVIDVAFSVYAER